MSSWGVTFLAIGSSLALGFTLVACHAPAAQNEGSPNPAGSPVDAGEASKDASTSSPSTPEAFGRGVVDALARRAFDDAGAAFDDTMRAALPSAKLRELWDGILANAGTLTACSEAKIEKLGGYTAVVVPCIFARASLEVRVVLGADRRVSGLLFKPVAASTSPYTSPAYVKADAFEEREVTVNPGPWALPGVLTLPKTGRPLPAVVLVHGSGPGDRDETIGANKPFKDLAAGLATLGVAVLRYDKRTRVYGKQVAASTDFTVDQESVDDAVAAASLLRTVPEIDAARVFVAGHSMGGELVPRIGKRDPKLAGLIVLSGSTRPIGPVMVEQLKYIFGLGGAISPEQQKEIDAIEAAWTRVLAIQGGAKFDPNEKVLFASPSYWLDLKGYDAPKLAKALPQRILVVQGGRDYQVTMADFERWKAALDGKAGATLKLYPTLSHLLARGDGKSTPEESMTRAPVDEELVKDVAAWVKAAR